jgi:hypothetical protein
MLIEHYRKGDICSNWHIFRCFCLEKEYIESLKYWCGSNLKKDWEIFDLILYSEINGYLTIEFLIEDDNDAMFFKLSWSE